MKWQGFWNDFIDLIFPRCCEACDASLVGNESIICTKCRIDLPRLGKDAIFKHEPLIFFDQDRPSLDVNSFLLFTKRGKVQKLLHALKYRGTQEVGIALGKMYAQEMLENQSFPDINLIVSVPLHPKKKQNRGFNQSDLIAEGISMVTNVPWSGTLLVRTKYTETQTGKGKQERRENVKNVFAVSEKVAAQRILLIDDVFTTGATVEACVAVLYEAGCEEVVVRTLAMANH